MIRHLQCCQLSCAWVRRIARAGPRSRGVLRVSALRAPQNGSTCVAGACGRGARCFLVQTAPICCPLIRYLMCHRPRFRAPCAPNRHATAKVCGCRQQLRVLLRHSLSPRIACRVLVVFSDSFLFASTSGVLRFYVTSGGTLPSRAPPTPLLLRGQVGRP